MELILAMDLKDSFVVHGKSGNRNSYIPLTWGLSPVAEPAAFIRHICPASVYIADLDRICGTGSHEGVIRQCNSLVRHCYADRGCRDPSDLLALEHFENVIGTETGGADLTRYHAGYLSIDIRDGEVIPGGGKPEKYLKSAESLDFDGCILLDISGVGTSGGISGKMLESYRSAYSGPLVWGGGISSVHDLDVLRDAGFEGAILATALHSGHIPIEMIRRGSFC